MRSFLNKKISIGTLLIVGFIVIFAITATSITIPTIQATLSPDISISYEGQKQILKDAIGNEIYPISYNGSTYIPIRAVASLLDMSVEWENETRTVILEKSVPLVNTSTADFKLPCNKWVYDKQYFPNFKYTFGIACQSSSRVNVSFSMDNTYKRLDFACYNNGINTMTLTVTDEESQKIIVEVDIDANETKILKDIDITGVKEFRIRTTASAVILEPKVK